MNPFKKFNTYLLENHPLLWHSKAVPLTFTGLIIWVVSYCVGYSLIDMEILQKNNILDYYFDSYYFYFYSITCIIIIIIWAFRFYKNNAFDNFYPLPKAYFTKLFFQIFIPFLLLLSAYYPFTLGVKSKTAAFFEETELKPDIDKINLGYVFLINEPYNIISTKDTESSFSAVLLNNDIDEHKRDFRFDEEIFHFNFLFANHAYTTDQYAEQALSMIEKKQYHEIQDAIDQFKAVCLKYAIKHNINSKHLIRYLQYKNFKNFYISIVKGFEDIDAGKNAQNEINEIQSLLKDKKKMMQSMEEQHVYFFDKRALNTAITNFKKMKTSLLYNHTLIPHVFAALFLAWLFMFFEITSMKSILITVPILGIIILVNCLIGFYASIGNNVETRIFLTFLSSQTLIVGIALLALKTKKMRKKMLDIWMNLTYCVFPVFLIALSLYLVSLPGIHDNKSANALLINPYLFFLFSLVGTISFYVFLRKWKAYAE